jgi:flavin-dependent dehydrogenase
MLNQVASLGFLSTTPGGSPAGGPVTVVGAGPAGLTCAIALARGGRKVIVREWQARVGHRFHGDFQGLENWSDQRDVLEELRAGGIEPDFDRVPVREGTAFDPWGKAYRIAGRRPLYYLVRRGDSDGSLDRGLLRQALDAGVEVRFGDRVETTATPSVLAIGPRVADVIAAGYVFDTDMPDGNFVALGNRLAPLGYAYLLVHRGRGTVASCMFSGFKHHAEYVERTVAFFREHAGLSMRNARRFGGFGNFRLPRAAQRGARLVAGEQAGFQDALAGFGMRYAMRSGLLAARSLLTGADYRHQWRRQLLPALRTGAVNRFVYIAMGERSWRWALQRLSRTDAGDALRRLYEPSLLKQLLYPLARLRYRGPLRDPSCDHVECGCVWCECREEVDKWTPAWARDN